ncbi:MAG: uracil-DNA glycosylase family protein [Candidatus Thermoplasmatota archaeon]|nr:uracil-DNA glycosylase family protein [Candidatus Thermoplasmatota archaeon]
MAVVDDLIMAAKQLSNSCNKSIKKIERETIVAHATNPLDYAWPHHEQYLTNWGGLGAKTLLLGMNPGPWGMAQSGVPFGSTEVAKSKLKIKPCQLTTPSNAHPKRPIIGLDLERQEISGQRLWSLMFDHFGNGKNVFSNIFVVNHCPLLLLGESGKNLTPDNLSATVMKPILEACDEHLKKVVDIMGITRIIGVGKYAEKRARLAFDAGKTGDGITKSGRKIDITSCWHPSPASPLANRNDGADWRANVISVLENA